MLASKMFLALGIQILALGADPADSRPPEAPLAAMEAALAKWCREVEFACGYEVREAEVVADGRLDPNELVLE